jgi:hypothetical protein
MGQRITFSVPPFGPLRLLLFKILKFHSVIRDLSLRETQGIELALRGTWFEVVLPVAIPARAKILNRGLYGLLRAILPLIRVNL